MRYRTGRKNGHTVYLQTGDEPSNHDPFVGSCVTPGHARNLVKFATDGLAVDGRLEALEEIRQRVADGWKAVRDVQGLTYWYNGQEIDDHVDMSPEVASVLWPEDTSS